MKTFMRKTLFILSVNLFCSMLALGEQDSLPFREDLNSRLQRQAELMDLYFPAVYDINRLPINVCFIKKDSSYVGFVIAGHAFKEACHTASLKIKTILNTIGYQDNTIFSFGVGYDRRNNAVDTFYHNRLKELESTCLDLQERDIFQVRVSYTTDSAFEGTVERIERNMHFAWNSMQENDSINRVIFRYNNIKYPVPVPFYNKDGIITFTIPKSRIGKIPDTRDIYAATIQNALTENSNALATNNRALQRLSTYNPIIRTSNFGSIKYPVIINNGIKKDTVKLIQFDTTKIIREYDAISGATIRYYSLAQLQNLCNSGQRIIKLKSDSRNTKVNTCKEATIIIDLIQEMNETKRELIITLNKANRQLTLDNQQLLTLRAQFNTDQRADTLLYIDAFLRGWVYATGDRLLNTRLNSWYNKRRPVWQELLTRYPLYKKRVKTKPDTLLVANPNNIAGIFQFDDVFFSVKATDRDYIITPYKLLGNDFIQIIDRQSNICQFFSVNNFRQKQL